MRQIEVVLRDIVAVDETNDAFCSAHSPSFASSSSKLSLRDYDACSLPQKLMQ